MKAHHKAKKVPPLKSYERAGGEASTWKIEEDRGMGGCRGEAKH